MRSAKNMVDWEALEEAGHDLTYCGVLTPSSSLYYCENCGAFVLLRCGDIAVFHIHRGSLSEQARCHNDVPDDALSLKSKLNKLQKEDLERLKEV